MHVRPVDLPELRADTLRDVAQIGEHVFMRAIETGRQLTMPVAPSREKAAAILTATELRRLRDAELFHVSAEMADLAVAAGRTLPEFSLMPEDIPAPNGFIYFASPIAVVDYAEDDESPAGQSPIVAASWSPWTGGNPKWVHGGVWITWYADGRALLENGVRLGIVERSAADKVSPTASRLVIDNEIQCPFSPDPIPAVRADGSAVSSWRDVDGIVRWLATLKAAWLLMAQPVTRVEDAVYDRAARRRAAREHSEPPRVRVITLRRPASTGNGESDREYHHQWIVRGHWRQQWYPSRQVNRPVWIAPHVKGPEGAPMLGGEKVYAWSR